MKDNFRAYSKYYDLLYRDKNYQEESRYVADILRNNDPSVKTILELGCGSGSHALFLCEDGFDVTGIDRSVDMVAAARKKNISGFKPVQGDISEFHIDQKFDACIALFHVISYLTGNQSLINCFKLTNAHLKNNGLFLFDVWYSPAVYSQKPEIRIKRLEDDKIMVTRIAEPVMHHQRNVVDVSFEVSVINKEDAFSETIKEKHPMRHFSIPEIELLANHTGFEVVHAEEFLSGKEPGIDTWSVCVIIKKTKND